MGVKGFVDKEHESSEEKFHLGCEHVVDKQHGSKRCVYLEILQALSDS